MAVFKLGVEKGRRGNTTMTMTTTTTTTFHLSLVSLGLLPGHAIRGQRFSICVVMAQHVAGGRGGRCVRQQQYRKTSIRPLDEALSIVMPHNVVMQHNGCVSVRLGGK